jgi:hypothetical protein
MVVAPIQICILGFTLIAFGGACFEITSKFQQFDAFYIISHVPEYYIQRRALTDAFFT